MDKALLHPRHWPVWFGLLLLRIVTFLPVSLLYGMAKPLGLLAYKFAQRRREVVETNIRLCFPELDTAQQAALVRENFINTAYGVVEILLAFWASKRFFAQHSEMRGMELLQQAQQQNRGVLLLGIHVTSLETSRRTLAQQIYDMDISYKQSPNPVFDYYLHRNRQKSFKNVIEKHDMRLMLKNLKAGRIVWLASDQDFGRDGSVFVPFFYELAATPANFGRILKLTGAKPLFYNHYRTTKNGKPYYIGEILDPFNDTFTEDNHHNARLYNDALAEAIAQNPAQYLWVHERFRTRPDADAPRMYSKKRKNNR